MLATLLIAALCLGIVLLLRKPHVRPVRANAPTSTRCTDPRQQEHLSPVWQLRRAPGCTAPHAQKLAGKRLATTDTVALAVPGKLACDCHYQALRDLRRRERRERIDRRAALRFEMQGTDRRQLGNSRRRAERIWLPLQRL